MVELERRVTMILVIATTFWSGAAAPADPQAVEEIVVTAKRRPEPAFEHHGNIEVVSSDVVSGVGHQHISELLSRVPGAWISRGSGQEHLTAIRSPVLTGPGSCGAYLMLEDGIPIRPAGFCNVNQMFELVTEQAARVEVIRGPGNALYGSNALHGIINVLMPAPDDARGNSFAAEYGSNDFLRVRGLLHGGNRARRLVTAVLTDDGGFRTDSGYRQAKLHARTRMPLAGGRLDLGLTATDLDQETAGFIFGKDAYRDPSVNRSNLNPEAFREASSERFYGIWQRSGKRVDADIRPYLRHNDMRFLQHFLPGQPLEENRHVSAGFLAQLSFSGDRTRTSTGVDLEAARIALSETQLVPADGSDFLRETRPVGKHYDFDVETVSLAPWVQVDAEISARWSLSGGLRAEYTHYDYDNRMLSGNTRDDGTVCGFGGCLFSRPADRRDSFASLAPKFSLRYEVNDNAVLFAVLARGFRAPQVTELYRLQSGQLVADLDAEILDSAEAGLRWQRPATRGELVIYAMQKRDSIFRDSGGFNVSGGRSRHAGVELALTWAPSNVIQLALDLSYGRHVYDFDTVAERGETFVSGNDVDTAPRWLGSAELIVKATDDAGVALQVATIGEYFLDAENRFRYPGHTVVNLRANTALTKSVSLTARLNNLLDALVADRADYAFGDYRYLPGRGRELFLELRVAAP